MEITLYNTVFSRAPLNRKDYFLVQLLLFTVVGVVYTVLVHSVEDTVLYWPVAVPAEILFFGSCFWLVARRLNAAGSEFFGEMGVIVLFVVHTVILSLAPKYIWDSLSFDVATGIILLSFAVFPDKPVSGTGWVRDVNGRYVRAAKEAAKVFE